MSTNGLAIALTFIAVALVTLPVLFLLRAATGRFQLPWRKGFSGDTLVFKHIPAAPLQPALRCHLRITASGIIISGRMRLRPAPRNDPRVIALLASRRSDIARSDEQAIAERFPESLMIRFQHAELPVTWQLWAWPPDSDDDAASEFRGPPHLRPSGAALRPTAGSSKPVRALLHLVGTPVPTSAGWRLRIPAGRSSSQPGFEESSRSAHVGDELLGPDAVAVARTALVVLQSEPTDGPPRSLGKQYEGMCALAADLRDAGAGAVLVVPPLPDERAARVATRCRARIAGRRTHPADVLSLAVEIRRIATPTAARDVLLFA